MVLIYEKYKGNTDYFNKLYDAINNDEIVKSLYNFLMNRNISKFNPSRDRQNNKIMDIMKEHNVDVILEFINYWKQESDDTDVNAMIKSRMKGMDLYRAFVRYYEMCGNNMNSKPSLTKFGTRIKSYEDKVSYVKSSGVMTYKLLF